VGGEESESNGYRDGGGGGRKEKGDCESDVESDKMIVGHKESDSDGDRNRQ
jgi:hypothetical protein